MGFELTNCCQHLSSLQKDLMGLCKLLFSWWRAIAYPQNELYQSSLVSMESEQLWKMADIPTFE